MTREFGKRFSDYAYAFEPLVSEFISAELGLPPILQRPEYLAHWIDVKLWEPPKLAKIVAINLPDFQAA